MSFWASVDALAAANDPRWQDVYDAGFNLVENGPLPPGARVTRWPIGGKWYDGFWVDVPGGKGFIGCALVPDIDGPFVVLYRLVWAD